MRTACSLSPPLLSMTVDFTDKSDRDKMEKVDNYDEVVFGVRPNMFEPR